MRHCTRLLWSSIAVLAFLPAIGMAQSAKPAAVQSSPTAILPFEYQDWLDQDVHWIINDEERSDFIRLASNEERDRFVEQFWARRSASPAGARNSFKEEHYRRIAFSNIHFASAAPGWSTDRGRTYILYGPPEEVRTEVIDGSPAQVWRYRSIPGNTGIVEFRFVDSCRCGSYPLVSTPAI